MRKEIQWHAVLLVVAKALLAGLAAIVADQQLGSPVAGLVRDVELSHALGAPLPSNSALLLSSPGLPLFVTPQQDWA